MLESVVYKDTITPIDANISLEFGKQIVISGGYFAISSPNSSKVYYYKFTANGYQLLTTLEKENGFGYRMSMDDPYLLVGAIDSQKAYLFKRSDENLTQIATVSPEIAFEKYYSYVTSSVAIKGNFFAVGISYEEDDMVMSGSSNTGSVYLYEIDANDTVVLKAKLRHPGLEAGAEFGEGVALSENYLAIGASGEDLYQDNSYYAGGTGGVYIYDLHFNAPKILNMPNTIVYAEGSDRTQLYQFQVSETVSYELSGQDASLFSINAQNNMLEANQDMFYTENNNTFAFTITIKTADANRSYNTQVALTPMVFHGLNYMQVTSPYTNRVWLDRNIGATEVCDSTKFDMSGCYGEYFQWGRGFDGHEKPDSNTSTTRISDLNNSGSDFIISNVKWVMPGVDDNGSLRKEIWSKTDGSSVCPRGFRVPTMAEFKAETTNSSASLGNPEDAMSNFLKLPAAGVRQPQDATIAGTKTTGMLWTTDNRTSNYAYSYVLHFGYSYGNFISVDNAYGLPVRCIEEN